MSGTPSKAPNPKGSKLGIHDRSKGLFEFVENDWEEFAWEGMPSFQHQPDAESHRSIVIHFKDEEDFSEFCRRLELKVTPKTTSVWYPQTALPVFSDKVWKARAPLSPKYPIYVISKGRWETRLTVKALEAMKVPYHVVIEPQEYDRYSSVVDPDKIHVLPFSNLGQGSIPARNWVWEHSISIGAKRHWILDDNIRSFFYYSDNTKCRVGDATCFAAIEEWVDQYENVPMAGMQYHMFAPRKRGYEHKPVVLNTRIYSCILLDNAIEHRWRGRYNEDTDLSIRILKDGYCTALFYVFLAEKMATMTMKGGNTDQLYVDDGRLKMAESLREQHPDIVHITTKWGRAQHHVNYSVFEFNRLVPKPDAKLPDLSNLMELRQENLNIKGTSTSRQDPVLIAVKKKPDQQDEAGDMLERLAFLEADQQVETLEIPAAATIQPKAKTDVAQQELSQTAVSIGVKSRRFAEVSVRPKESWVHPFLLANQAVLDEAGDSKLALDASSWNHDSKSAVGFDVEVFSNFFVACFKRFSDGKRVAFEMSSRGDLDRVGLRSMLVSNLIVSFNGSHFDLPITWMALNGADCASLKDVCNRIIHGELKGWELENSLGMKIPKLDHVDLMEPNPSVRQSLKMLHARLHGRYLVDLPFDPEAWLSPRQMNITTLYCHNDIDATELLWDAMREPIELRAALSKEYGVDFRSRSDAQIGEAIVRRRVEAATGRRASKPRHTGLFKFRYRVPDFISFQSQKLQTVAADLEQVDFVVNGLGRVETPDLLKDMQLSVGDSTYTMGVGGLHSTETHRALRSDEDRVLIDTDVASQYPNIILKLGMYPKALGPKFLEVYAKLISERMAAKASGDKVKADSGKIAANGVFGKLGSIHSVLFNPEMFIATTLTGQLSILMLVEQAELSGINAVSANTDGVIFYCLRSKETKLGELLSEWEKVTGFTVEQNKYAALHSSSVNTYIAIAEDGKVKRKGPIADPWSDGDLRSQMSKNPQMTICAEAVLRLITNKTPIEQTIRSCQDPRMFLTVIKADGATWRGNSLGRVARYYWSTNGDPIYVANGARKVPKTDGARPLLELTEAMPSNVDYRKYVQEASKLAVELAVVESETLLMG